MAGMISRARRSPTGWLLACLCFGIAGALVGLLVSWASGWPVPIAVVAGTAIGLLLAARALRRPVDTIAVLPPGAVLDEVRSGGVRLRRFEAKDAQAGSLVATIDEEVAASMGWTPDEVAALSEMASTPELLTRQGFLAIGDTDSDTVLGVVSLSREPGSDTTARVGLWLGPGARGRGLGPEALRLAVAVAWQSGMGTIVCGTTSTNIAMQRCFLAVGADAVETTPHELPDGRTVDSVWYELHRPDATPIA